MIRAAAAAIGLLALAACAAPEPPAPPPQSALSERLLTERAVVQSVDAEARQVMLRDPQGQVFTALLTEDGPALDRLEPGDEVVTRRYRGVVVARAGAQAPERPEDAFQVVEADEAAARPGARYSRYTDEAATLVDYDASAGTAVLDIVGGDRRTVSVARELRPFYASLAPGDRIELSTTEVTTVEVAPGR